MKAITDEDWLKFGFGCVVFSPLLGALCVLGISIGLWIRYLRLLSQDVLHQALGVLGLGLILTACFSIHRGDAFLGLFHFLPYFLVFAALRLILNTPQRLYQFAWIVVLCALPVNLLGLGQLFGGWAGPITLKPFIDWPLAAGGEPTGRMSSVFAYANVLANYLVIIWPLAIGLSVDALRASQWTARSPQNLRQPQYPKLFQSQTAQKLVLVLLGLIVLTTGAALILTDSRNAWAIAVLVGLSYAIYLGWHWILASFSFIVAIVAGAAFAPPPLQAPLRAIVPAFFWARLNDQLYPDRPVEQLRSTQWEFAWSMATQRPLTGWGLRSFSGLYEAKTGLVLGHPHNLYLMLTAETGFVTTAIFIGIVGGLVGRASQFIAQLPRHSSAQFVGFMYLTAFLSTSLFHLLDIPLFDLRINLLGWFLLAGLASYAVPMKPRVQTPFNPS